MIVGLGLDVCATPRMARALARFGERFWERILTPRERAELAARRGCPETLAGRFAAKEAASKALGAPKDVWWHDVEVLCDAQGAPRLTFSGKALPRLAARGAARSWLSISHDAGIAAAVVVLEAE